MAQLSTIREQDQAGEHPWPHLAREEKDGWLGIPVALACLGVLQITRLPLPFGI